jgi:Na+-transporting NADH:ubiquinone oxidoreductase subunit D
MGYQIIPDFMYSIGYVDNGLMILPPMALITVGIIVWVHRERDSALVDVS